MFSFSNPPLSNKRKMPYQVSQLSHTGIFDLSVDIKYIILNYLDNRSLAYLSQTCTYFGMLQFYNNFEHTNSLLFYFFQKLCLCETFFHLEKPMLV